MFVIAGLGLGAAIGALRARRRGGKALDMAHYAAVHTIAGGLAGMILTIILARSI